MKFPKIFIKSIIIFAVVSIIFIAKIPYAGFQYLTKNVVDGAVATFNHYGDIADSLFLGEFGEQPKTIEGFDFDQLQDSGKQINIDYDETIKLIKEPFGSYWISDALGTTIITLVKQLATTILKSYVKNRIIVSILTLFGFLLIMILSKYLLKNQIHKSELLQEDNLGPKRLSRILDIFSILFVTLLLLMSGYFIFNFIRHISSFLKYPPICNFAEFDTTSSFYFEELVLLIGIIFSISIFIKIIHEKKPVLKKFFVLFWAIPIIAIGFNLYLSNQNISVFNKMLDTQNLNSNRQMVVSDCAKIAYSARQWFLSNKEDKKLEELTFEDTAISQQTENGIYNISIKDNILTITGKGNYISKDGENNQVKVTYDSVTNSINTKIRDKNFIMKE
ncbi:MAG: hypothetical protein P9L95_09435 [Candidatus Tenebribacter mawsonii]|nr:hypothetical protein [Candidatus Tenebribacter mawsonii]